MNRRQFLRVGAVGALTSTAGCSMAIFGTNQGRVVEKAVRAWNSGKRLITSKPNGVSAVDGYPGNKSVGNVSVTDEAFGQLSKSYGDLTYEVTIYQYRSSWPNDAKEGERNRYEASRAVFNQLSVGDNVTFQPEPTDTSTISSLSCIASDRASLSARCSTDETGGDSSSSP